MNWKQKLSYWWCVDARYYPVIRQIRDGFWALQHRFNPRHRYNVIYLKLKPGYYDPDTRLKHAIFEEVVHYVETAQIEWSADERHVALKQDLDSIVYWWKHGRQKAIDREEQLLSDWYEAAYGGNPKALPKEEIDRIFAAHHKAEMDVLETDRRYMKVAIDHLDNLWYP